MKLTAAQVRSLAAVSERLARQAPDEHKVIEIARASRRGVYVCLAKRRQVGAVIAGDGTVRDPTEADRSAFARHRRRESKVTLRG